jgi:hypothetical protein
MPVTDTTLTDSLTALKTQYERSLTQANTNASHLREQLSHVNALLLNQLLQSKGVVPQLTQSGGCKPKPSKFPADFKTVRYSQSIPAKIASKSIG